VIEEIETELEQKGQEYWRYLLTKALQDKSLDVLEHFTMTFLVEGTDQVCMSSIIARHAYLRASWLKNEEWLVSLNARTLVELWNDNDSRPLAESLVSELESKNVSPLFNSLAFGERARAS